MIDLQLLQDSTYHTYCQAGQQVLTADSGTRMFHILLSGRVDIIEPDAHGRLLPAGTVAPGEPFGLEAFFGVREAPIFICREECRLFTLDKARFVRAVAANPALAFDLMAHAYTFTGYQPAQARPIAQDAAMQQTGAAEQPPPPSQPPPQQPAARTAEPAAAPAVQSTHSDLFPPGHPYNPGLTRPEYRKYIFEKQTTCPQCGQAFDAPRIFSSKLVTAQPMRYDMRKYYTDFQSEWYDIITCPHCYFSMFTSYFESAGGLSRIKIRDALEQARASLTLPFNAERDLDFVFAAHYLALACTPGYMNYRQLNARIWANISWLYEDIDNQAMTRYAAHQCADAYEQMYIASTLNPTQEQLVCLSIAGMLYRSDDASQVRSWLFKAKTIRGGKSAYVNMADHLMDILREEKNAR